MRPLYYGAFAFARLFGGKTPGVQRAKFCRAQPLIKAAPCTQGAMFCVPGIWRHPFGAAFLALRTDKSRRSACALLLRPPTKGLLSPIYAHCRRNGCWFCPNASDEELLHMITKHPELFDRLIEWEKEDNIFHRWLTRRETPSEVKARLLSKSQTGFSSPRNKSEMEV